MTRDIVQAALALPRQERVRGVREPTGVDYAAIESTPVRFHPVREHAEESDNFLGNSDDESRRVLVEHFSGILGGLMAGWVAESAIAPSEDELHEKLDLPRRRALVLETLQSMGDDGKVLILRYVERLEWADVGAQLGMSTRHATNIHNQALPRLAALLAKKKH